MDNKLPQYEQYKSTFAGVSMPLAYVNLDLLDANIQSIAAAAQGKTIRIASKSIRCVSVLFFKYGYVKRYC